MGRGHRGLFDDLIKLPWPVALVFGVLGYAAIRHGVPALFARQGGPFGQAFSSHSDVFAPLAWMFLAACTLCALVAFANARKRRRLLDAQTGLDSIAAIGWRDFERLVGEAFRRQGYSVEETGLGGADGGIDLILRKDGRRTLVQCKHWRRRQVPVNVVREMYSLLAHHGAHAVQIATAGGFTRDAARFAADKPITLIDGPTLLAMIRSVQGSPVASTPPSAALQTPRVGPAFATPVASPATPDPGCPTCGGAMVQRVNRRTRDTFQGCARFPACRGTR